LKKKNKKRRWNLFFFSNSKFVFGFFDFLFLFFVYSFFLLQLLLIFCCVRKE